MLFACTIVVRGRVQGVCFRATTVSEARRLGVAGWVRNEPGGEVRIEAEGAREALEALVDWCRHGPEYAVVEHLDVAWHAPGLDSKHFSIR
ncbi:MAG: acylphosphatase [Gammaproteobacteria bacterium]|nr:acylphosphatase [Gammaproteobacteria bacterium]